MLARLQQLWDATAVPLAVEYACAQRSVERQREKIIPLAEGRVLEVGVGSGLNLPLYRKDRVEAVVGVDPSAPLLRKAEARARRVDLAVQLSLTTAEALPFEVASFDTLVVTYTLCSVLDPARALSEMRRVLRPGGLLLLSEHGRAPDEATRRWQARLEPMWRRLGGGCHLTRPVAPVVEAAGFDVAAFESMYLPGPRWLNFHTWGAARARD